MYIVKATRSKSDRVDVIEIVATALEAVRTMGRLLKEFRTIEIVERTNLGFRQGSMLE